jgi:hypothetical protein
MNGPGTVGVNSTLSKGGIQKVGLQICVLAVQKYFHK